jgi:hypothetical protein
LSQTGNKEQNALYALVNVWLPDGSWAGQFMDKSIAEAWLRKKGIKPEACEISKRGPERKRRG